MTNPSAAPLSDTDLEELAAIEHARWSHWQKYMHSKCEPGPNGCLIIPRELVERWERQANTDYERLPEAEKRSDRSQVLRYLPMFQRFADERDRLLAIGAKFVAAYEAGDGDHRINDIAEAYEGFKAALAADAGNDKLPKSDD